ncbi:MAG: phospholipase D-like domain-containing protein, partial [Flavobacteriales bacterium]|nr:phospholipase D-like domain-containing protein [Flavobacteriales bacterium]
IDGHTAFIGGINISDRYVNRADGTGPWWRDTHLMIAGSGALQLQYIFLCDWNFCAGQQLGATAGFFPKDHAGEGDVGVQVAASGPDSPRPTIMLSLLRAITMAREEILLTTPYFIPGESISEALRVAALAGVRVRLLVPARSDSWLVNAAAWSFYDEMLAAGVEIHMYRRGFVHAKTMVVDGLVAVVGTANMDQRSFDLNFEVNAVLYSREVAGRLRTEFERDLGHAGRVDPARWAARPLYKQFPERLARLAAPLL